MNTQIEEVEINGTKYVRKDSIQGFQKAESVDGMEYMIVRTYSAGVFAGYVAERDGKEVLLKKARRLWYWSGAASLSQLSTEGTKKPDQCKFPCEVPEILVTEAIEILPVSAAAKKSIESVAVWKA